MRINAFFARYRVALGFVSAVVCLWLARPTLRSVAIGAAIAVAGEVIRIWAAGHIEKDREITSSGPYRYVRHPLYLGSSLIGIGFAIAAQDLVVTLIVVAYLAVTLGAAIRSEEALLDARFAGAYASYRAGQTGPVTRQFSLQRVWANREYRALTGLAVGLAVLWWRASS